MRADGRPRRRLGCSTHGALTSARRRDDAGDKLSKLSTDQTGDWCEVRRPAGEQGWVPSSYVTAADGLDKFPWYHGPISRSAAECLLNR